MVYQEQKKKKNGLFSRPSNSPMVQPKSHICYLNRKKMTEDFFFQFQSNCNCNLFSYSLHVQTITINKWRLFYHNWIELFRLNLTRGPDSVRFNLQFQVLWSKTEGHVWITSAEVATEVGLSTLPPEASTYIKSRKCRQNSFRFCGFQTRRWSSQGFRARTCNPMCPKKIWHLLTIDDSVWKRRIFSANKILFWLS